MGLLTRFDFNLVRRERSHQRARLLLRERYRRDPMETRTPVDLSLLYWDTRRDLCRPTSHGERRRHGREGPGVE